MKRNVVLLGKGKLAVRIAEWFHRSDAHELRWVVPVIPEPTWTDSLIDWCERNNVEYVPSGDYHDLPGARAADWSVDIAFSVFYDKIIKEWFIEKARRICNLHNGPLPRYRGVSPINWALKNGETSHGVTIHEITPRIDAGPIISQLDYSICPESDEVEDVYQRALEYGYTLFERTMPNLDKISPRPQDESQAMYYSRKDDAKLGDRRDFRRALLVQMENGGERSGMCFGE